MGKMADRIKAAKHAAKNQEGLIRVSFSFGGKVYVRTHQMNPMELQAAKDMLAEHGGEAFKSATLKSALFLGRNFGEYVVDEALKEYGRNHWTPKATEVVPTWTVFDPEMLASGEVTAQEVIDRVIENQKIELSQSQIDAVDETAGLSHVKETDRGE